jgi:alkanesulfonate monooxygenase SsuD/methylene tetrahydromethanopterin reductase-like flavin-dependent oxidoreductase (luciferase family)
MENGLMAQVSSAAAVGTPDQVRAQTAEFLTKTGADELIIVAQIHDHDARCKSYELAYQACADL